MIDPLKNSTGLNERKPTASAEGTAPQHIKDSLGVSPQIEKPPMSQKEALAALRALRVCAENVDTQDGELTGEQRDLHDVIGELNDARGKNWLQTGEVENPEQAERLEKVRGFMLDGMSRKDAEELQNFNDIPGKLTHEQKIRYKALLDILKSCIKKSVGL